MNILWVTNTIFPELSRALGQNAPVVGGWMYGLANSLSNQGVNLTVVTVRPNAKTVELKINQINYFLLKGQKQATEYDDSLSSQWTEVVNSVKPDVVHIHGTEYAHGLALLKTCPDLNYVISIQGLISVYARYYTGHIPNREIKKHTSLRDFIKKDGILYSQKSFYKRGELIEKEYFRLGKNFIGRTQWDFDHTKSLNSKATYHFCNESLRDGFYNSKKWNENSKAKNTIFISQAIYPIKGLHQILKAISLVKNDFEDVKIRIAGGNITKVSSFKEKIGLGGYGKYIRYLIKKLKLKNHIEFTGVLNESQMIEEYLKCNVFVCPSSIENSPNSLGEAQLLGVPCISSYVGGVPDMVKHEQTGLIYRFEEFEMLAQCIMRIFRDQELAKRLSFGGIQAATKRHNRETNLSTTLNIYHKIKSQ